MTAHDTLKLQGVDARLVSALERILAAMAALGFPMLVTDGRRTVEEQRALYAQGRATPGPIVTYKDGLVQTSRHQTGHAVDCAFVVNETPSWAAQLPWKTYGACAEALGLRWGGSWQTLHDLPHVELA